MLADTLCIDYAKTVRKIENLGPNHFHIHAVGYHVPEELRGTSCCRLYFGLNSLEVLE